MDFLHIKTNNLVDIVGRNEQQQIDWSRVGTDSKAINLSAMSIGKRDESGILTYILPITNKTNTTDFINGDCATYGVFAEILNETDAKLKYDELKAYVETTTT